MLQHLKKDHKVGYESHGRAEKTEPDFSCNSFFFSFFYQTLNQSYLTIISEDSSMVEESPGSFQLYRDWEIPCETTATGRELPTIHTYRVVSPAGLEPTRQRCVASRETNLATD